MSFITMTSLWRHLLALNTATFPLESSRNEQRAITVFLVYNQI